MLHTALPELATHYRNQHTRTGEGDMAATGALSEVSEASRDRRGMVTGQDEYPAELRLKDTLLRAARVGLARHTSGAGS
ncbi:unnamed protein product, partial [Ectocarpus sp. 4 AP-2014]